MSLEGGRPCSLARPLYRVRRGVPPTNAFLPSFTPSLPTCFSLSLSLWRAFIGGTGACLRAVVAVVAVAAWRSSIMLQVAAAMCAMPAARLPGNRGGAGWPASRCLVSSPAPCVCPLPSRPFDNTPLLLPSLSPSFFPSFHCYFLLPPPIVFIFPFPR